MNHGISPLRVRASFTALTILIILGGAVVLVDEGFATYVAWSAIGIIPAVIYAAGVRSYRGSVTYGALLSVTTGAGWGLCIALRKGDPFAVFAILIAFIATLVLSIVGAATDHAEKHDAH